MKSQNKINFVLDHKRINNNHYAFTADDEKICCCIIKHNDSYIELNIFKMTSEWRFDEIRDQFLDFLKINKNVKRIFKNGSWEFYQIEYDFDSHKDIVAPIIEHNNLIELDDILVDYSTADLQKLIDYRANKDLK